MRGFGVSEVTATGPRSELGRIGQALRHLAPEVTPMYREVRRMVRWVAGGGLLLCLLVALLYGATRHDWLGGVLAGITLAMGVLPEEFPVVLTVFLAMGAWRISKRHVLTRHMPAIETIGDGSYPLSRSLYIYVNKAKAAANPAIGAYVDYYLADGTISTALETVPYVNLTADELAKTVETWNGSH